jgi:hypothetical protein
VAHGALVLLFTGIQAANAKAAEKIGSILNVDNSVDKAVDKKRVNQMLTKREKSPHKRAQ